MGFDCTSSWLLYTCCVFFVVFFVFCCFFFFLGGGGLGGVKNTLSFHVFPIISLHLLCQSLRASAASIINSPLFTGVS